MATSPDPKVQDAAGAVEFARLAVAAVQDSGIYRNTLGTALYRAGDWSGAIEALRKSNELDANTALGFNAYFLAMAHERRGEARPARLWFDIAENWHRRKAPNDPELRRFRAEAAGVLGLRPDDDRASEPVRGDDAALARLILEADPNAGWARKWLTQRRASRPAGSSSQEEMPNGPDAFARP
jgi:hypothetical protein